jgi:hypothetical protein
MHKKISISMMLLMAAILVACSGTPTGNVTNNYSVRGMLFHDLNNDNSFGYAIVLDDNEPISSLISYIVTGEEDSTQLNPIGNGAYLSPEGELDLDADSSYYFWAGEEFGDFYFAKQLEIADTFKVEITNLPPSREYGGSGPVTVEWNPPSQDFGYFITVVPPNDDAQPYWSFTETESVPYDAFTTTDGIRVPGTYYIYVIAYYQTFYSDGYLDNNDYIFFPYPDTGFVDNINLIDVKGRFGSVTASYYDSVIVIEQTQ